MNRNEDEIHRLLEDEQALIHDYTELYVPQLKQYCTQAKEGQSVYQLLVDLIQKRQNVSTHEFEKQLSDVLNGLE
jgi:hypothetical protein